MRITGRVHPRTASPRRLLCREPQGLEPMTPRVRAQLERGHELEADWKRRIPPFRDWNQPMRADPKMAEQFHRMIEASSLFRHGTNDMRSLYSSTFLGSLIISTTNIATGCWRSQTGEAGRACFVPTSLPLDSCGIGNAVRASSPRSSTNGWRHCRRPPSLLIRVPQRLRNRGRSRLLSNKRLLQSR